MKFIKYIFLFLVFVVCYSCKKNEIKHITKVQTEEFSLSFNSVFFKGLIVDIDNFGIRNHGHCWTSLNSNPTIFDNKTELGTVSEPGVFSSEIKNLSANTTYYFRAYATDGSIVTYGEVKSFNTSLLGNINISTSAASILNESSATIDGSITGLGSVNIIDYGHCWAKTNNPTIANNHTSNGLLQTDNNFKSTISSLSLESNYFIRAYAKFDNNTIIYSSEVNLYIPDLKIKTDTVTVPTGNNAIFQGSITSLGVYPITDHGHCWSYLTSNPNINNNKLSLGAINSTGKFFSNLTLTPSYTYYYRAYVIANGSIKYGAVKKIVY